MRDLPWSIRAIGDRELLRVQLAKRQAFPARQAQRGCLRDGDREIRKVIEGREHRFRNADRLDLLLALIRNEIDNRASVAGYARVIRTMIDGRTGRAGVDSPRPLPTSVLRHGATAGKGEAGGGRG
jgi:hypothetical protein